MVERSAVDSSNGTQLCRRHAHSHAFLAEAHRGMPSWLSTGRSSLRRTWTRARRQSPISNIFTIEGKKKVALSHLQVTDHAARTL